MGYDRKVAAIQPDSTWEAAITLSTTGDKANCLIMSPITVYRIGVLVTTAFTATALVADFDRRITNGSDTGAAFTGGLNILDAAFEPLFGNDGMAVWMLGQEGLYPVATRLLRED